MFDALSQHLPVDALRTFVAAAELGSFTRAAEQVHRTQAAVSMQVKRLEELLEHPLFLRQGRGVELTLQGETFLGYARRLVRMHDEALSAIRTPELAGVVRFGAPESYASLYLPPILKGFAASHPRVHLELRCDSSEVLLQLTRAGELDLTLSTEAPNSSLPGDGELVHRESVVWVATPEFPLPVPPGEELPLALFHHGCLFRKWTLEALSKSGRPYRIACSSPSISALLAAVRAGLAVAPVARSIPTPDLRVIDPEVEDVGLPVLPRPHVLLFWAPGAQSAPVRSFARHVRLAFAPRHSPAPCAAT